MRRYILFLASCALTACVSTRHDPVPTSPPPPPPPIDTPSATTTPGKTNPYEVFGQRYYPITDATGYRERGVASWYGGKFHGRKTANGDRYDMYQYTAAHTTLPLPTWVKVTNLRNGSTVTVRVNDRGPFVKNRLIDLSYAAALQLGMVDSGTTLVEVEAIAGADSGTSVHTAIPTPLAALAAIPVGTRVATNTESADTGSAMKPAATYATSPSAANPDPTGTPVYTDDISLTTPDDSNGAAPTGTALTTAIYVQVGAFGDLGNAQGLQSRLYNARIDQVRLNSGDLEGIGVHRVQIGPITGVQEYDELIAKLEALGISDTHLVTE